MQSLVGLLKGVLDIQIGLLLQFEPFAMKERQNVINWNNQIDEADCRQDNRLITVCISNLRVNDKLS
jgi:hypothetical protein